MCMNQLKIKKGSVLDIHLIKVKLHIQHKILNFCLKTKNQLQLKT